MSNVNDEPNEALIDSYDAGDMPAFLVALERGADADYAEAKSGGMTPLLCASFLGHLEIVSYLLFTAKADVDKAKTAFGETPLFMASQEGHAQVVSLLLSARADVNKARTRDGATPLLIASHHARTRAGRLAAAVGPSRRRQGQDRHWKYPAFYCE
jgi:ankyrin repeat protein